MGLVYFRRYRMRLDLTTALPDVVPLPPGLTWRAFDSSTVATHAQVKYEAFAGSLDSYVFACLAHREGCVRLMREIVSRREFVAGATWLIVQQDSASAVGTIQGLRMEDASGRAWGSIQNVGVVPSHRRRRLGAALLSRSAEGFRRLGLSQMKLEVTTDNDEAVSLYERLGFEIERVVYKAADLPGMTSL